MSDLLAGQLPSGSSPGRPQNGGTGASQAPASVRPDPPRGVRAPTDVMRDRRAREARKRAAEEEAARQKELEEQIKREREEYDAGVVEDPLTQRRPYRPQDTSQMAQPGERRQESMPASLQDPAAQPRRTTLDRAQQRPVSSRQQAGQGYSQQTSGNPTPGAVPQNPRRNRNDTTETLNMPPNSTTKPNPQVQMPGAQQQSAAQTANRSGFPHAFERWETLSSHWEGLTSYWIRRLQENTNELENKPIDQQMSRQITDLSAAGANLFHAVVELQRLRASSERKFQRWFFETRTEQERAQEIQAGLERQLQAEREQRTQSGGAIAAAQAEKTKADELVREMRRELQISKEEARRAWEELGRREQEERERTAALRSGEPTVIGGVHVVPMSHRGPSRQNTTASRPQTSDGTPAAGRGPSTTGGQPRQPPSRSQTGTTLDSADDEQRKFTNEPYGGNSPTSTDPFTETGRGNDIRHGPGGQAAQQITQRPTQPATSSAAIAAARVATSQPALGGESRFQQQPATDTTFSDPLSTTGALTTASYVPPRPATSGTEQSYIASTISGSEDEYETNPDGSFARDPQGRRIPHGGQHLGAIRSNDGSDDDEYDVQADVERERMHAQHYGGGQSAGLPRTTPGNVPQSQPLTSRPTQQTTTYSQGTSSQAQSQQVPTSANYEGAGWSPPSASSTGWEGITGTPRHEHPTRLSDILEERSGWTSPSRASYTGGGGEQWPGSTGRR